MRRYARDPAVIWDDVDGVMTLCDVRSGEFYELNATGATIWLACLDADIATVLRVLHAEYPTVEAAQLAADVQAHLTALATHHLLTVSEQG
jgi:hypothetical protein